MGYSIVIGELPLDDPSEAPAIISRDNAPAFGEPTDYSNQRWPSYLDWENFTKEISLHDMFFNKKTGLMRKHPGMERLTKKHKQMVDKAMYEYEKKGEKDFNYNRLVWLKYWVDWALKFCHSPVFYNA
jgi:hypothetical protein